MSALAFDDEYIALENLYLQKIYVLLEITEFRPEDKAIYLHGFITFCGLYVAQVAGKTF
jgi:hypothetical protein